MLPRADKRPHEKRTKCGQKPKKNLRWLFPGTYVGFKVGSWLPWFKCNVQPWLLTGKGAFFHDAGMNAAFYHLQRREDERFELNVSLFMGAAKPRKWVKVDLKTKDQENAEARACLILRLSYRLGLFPAEEVPLVKVKDPQGREKRIREGRQSGGRLLPRILALN